MNPLDNFVNMFTEEKIESVEKNGKFFLINDDLRKLEESIPNVISSGIFLGERIEGSTNGLKPSIYLLEWLSPRTENKIIVNDKAEWLFLCGRDALPESITSDTSYEETFLVQNTKDENLGLGKSLRRGKITFVKNILDRGDFLRRERR